MSKPKHARYLLTRMTVVRDGQRKSLAANTTHMITDAELALLEKLEKKTGRPHLRQPVNEAPMVDVDDDDSTDEAGEADAGENDDDDVDGDDGDTIDLDAMTVKQLKEHLDASGTEYPSTASKAELLSLAKGDGGL